MDLPSEGTLRLNSRKLKVALHSEQPTKALLRLCDNTVKWKWNDYSLAVCKLGFRSKTSSQYKNQ